MTFQNSNGYNLYWTTSRTNKQLHAWCLENGINLNKGHKKAVFIKALEEHMAACGIDLATHPDFIRARA